jgi:hypothetical protein
MGELYLRKVILQVVPERGAAKLIDELRIKFKVEKTNESAPNTAEIQIYNASESTRSLLEAKNTQVRISFGYLGLNPNGVLGTGFASTSNVDLVYVGDITKVTQKFQRPDIISELECGDGDNRFRNSRLSKGYPPGTKVDLILDDLIKAMGLSKGSRVGVPPKKYGSGVALSGLAKTHLDMICKANNLEWSIQDGSIQIIRKDLPSADPTIILDADSGLIGSPSKTKEGVEFTSLIQPDLKPGRRVQLKSRTISGIFKVRKVTHEGDSSAQGQFHSKCEATRV